MPRVGRHGGVEQAPPADGVTFLLEQLEWRTSDRLELLGRWSGIDGERLRDATLVVHGNGASHRLEAMPWSVAGRAVPGQRWRAVFAWSGDGPLAFESAELEIGADLVVDL